MCPGRTTKDKENAERMPHSAKSGFWEGIHLVVSSCFGVGYFPFAPATAVTFILSAWMFVVFREPSLLELPVCAVLFLVAVKSAGHAEKILGHDAHEIVIDEVCGTLITFLLIGRTSLGVVIAGFILFRFFDILKPWPVDRSQNLPGGLGVVMDDVLAGVYSNLLLRGLIAAHFV
jgi:phosphatidylglycerophosphatase A